LEKANNNNLPREMCVGQTCTGKGLSLDNYWVNPSRYHSSTAQCSRFIHI